MALTGQGLANFAKSKVGTPYVYGAKGAEGPLTLTKVNSLARAYPSIFTSTYIAKSRGYVGRVCTDCSGLISWYTGRILGSSQMYSTASKRIPISQINSAPVGAVLWKSGHVGVYLGNGKVAEAKGINYGTVISNVSSTRWQYALLFSYIDYSGVTVSTQSVQPTSTPKTTSIVINGKNPYTQPAVTLRKGSKGDGVKWIQWELVEAGYDLSKSGGIDGDFGSGTVNFVKQFQRSSKIEDDGIVGPATRAALIAN